MNEYTEVIFRYDPKSKTTIAVFPYLVWNRDGDVTYFEDEHAGCDYQAILKQTVPATPEQFIKLKRSLQLIGYDLKRITKIDRKKYSARIWEAKVSK